MPQSVRTDHLDQIVLSRQIFETLSLKQRESLLEGPPIGICLFWTQVTVVPKRLLMAISPAFNRAAYMGVTQPYWQIPAVVHNRDNLLAVLAICDWMHKICSTAGYVPLPPHPIRAVSEAMYTMCIAMEMPPYEGHLAELKEFLKSQPEKDEAKDENDADDRTKVVEE